MYKQKGLTLLEVILAITIGVVIITYSIRYFMTVEFNYKVERTIKQIQVLAKASYQWLQMQRQADFGSGSTAIDNSKLQAVGLITKADLVDPWGGTIVLQPGENPQYIKITLSGIPKSSCLNLWQKMRTVARFQSDKNACTGLSYFIEL